MAPLLSGPAGRGSQASRLNNVFGTNDFLQTTFSLLKSRIAIADSAQGQRQRIHVARQPLGFVHVDNLFLEQLREVLIEALAARLTVADGAFELLEFALHD